MTVNRRGKQSPRVAVVAMQGDYDAHLAAVAAAGGAGYLARTPEAVADADALILPGGESTTIGKLLARYGLDDAIKKAADRGIPVFGTCAGMILLARRIVQGEKRGGQPTLALMDIAVARNAFGRQVDSFEADIDAPDVAGDEAVRGVFIRAPYAAEVGPGIDILARYEDKPVLLRQGNLLAAAFHPELTGDARVHEYFLQMTGEDAENHHNDT